MEVECMFYFKLRRKPKTKKSYCRLRRTVTFTTLGMILDSHAYYYHYRNDSRVQSIEINALVGSIIEL